MIDQAGKLTLIALSQPAVTNRFAGDGPLPAGAHDTAVTPMECVPGSCDMRGEEGISGTHAFTPDSESCPCKNMACSLGPG